MKLSLINLSVLAFVIIVAAPSCQKEISCENCKPNLSPIANAGIDQIITLPVDSVLLDGAGSTDPDGSITEWSWTKISGPSSYKIIYPNTMKTTLNNLTAGVYQFELKVTDNQGAMAKDTLQVAVNSQVQLNQPPIANAGTDQTITLPLNSVTVSGAGSADPDGNITQWHWSKISGPASFQIVNPDAMQTSVTNLAEGIYQFELKVTDDQGAMAKDTLQVAVNSPVQPNQPPIAKVGADQTITLPVNSVTVSGAGSADPDGNITQWRWTKISGPSSFHIVNPDAMQTSVTDLAEGIYQFELKVTDSGGLSDKDTLLVFVNLQQNQNNVNFYFPDPTGTMPYIYAIFTNPSPSLITISINDSSGVLSGVWCKTCSPRCPILADYNAEAGNYIDFNLPPGTYNWSAVSSIFSFVGYPGTTPEFRQFFSTSHSTGGTITVNPGDNCIIVKIIF